MKISSPILLLCCLLVMPALTFAQMSSSDRPAVGSQVAPAQVYGKLLSGIEKEVVELADAMPEDKYNFVPSQGEYKGVSNFSEMVKHIAESNYYFFGKMANADPGAEEAVKKLSNKAEIMKALKDSFVVAHKGIDSITVQNAFEQTERGTRAGTAALAMSHMMDHYGQLVEYLRLNGIIPPASRKKS